MIKSELHLEIAQLQKEIANYIKLDPANIIFEFKDLGETVDLDMITVSPRHKQSFLFHSLEGYNKVDALQKMLDYIKTYRDKESSFTIQWSLKGHDELNTSYFRAQNIQDALDKFYHGRDINSTTVFSLVLNPIS